MKSFFNDLLRLIFPQRCVLCNQILLSDSPLCEDCRKGNPRLSILRETACSSCVAPYAYEGAVRESIIRFKFNGSREYASFYGCAMAEAFREQKPDFLPDMLVAVPLSKKRLKKRGYNQAELLANAMAKHFSAPVISCLGKRDSHSQQHFLDKAKRRENVKGIYCFTGKVPVKEKRILLVDDIVTTGATLDECASVLYRHGAKAVVCAAAASAELDGVQEAP